MREESKKHNVAQHRLQELIQLITTLEEMSMVLFKAEMIYVPFLLNDHLDIS